MTGRNQTFPTGDPVADTRPALVPNPIELTGQTVTLLRPDPERDAAALYAATHGPDADPGQWTYMAYGPFDGAADMQRWMSSVSTTDEPLFVVVRDTAQQRAVGMASFMNIVPEHRHLELGNIFYAPSVRRSAVNTETLYLMLRYTFDELRYRRVEWKCDAHNARSRAAALRLGFDFEGVFRQHMVIRGRNRDTAWFAMLDGDWPRIRRNFESVLYDADNTGSLSELNRQR